MSDSNEIRDAVRRRYAAAARRALEVEPASCCPPGCCGDAGADTTDVYGSAEKDVISRDLYAADEMSQVPEAAVLASLGCGNPAALAELRPGEVVLDLGSGGGIDVLLSARRVGPAGMAYGVDMTDEMLYLARRNQREAGISNAEFLKGSIEDIPLPDGSVDVIISNCVINLSTDKDRVLREAFRVLRPGGRFAVSDVVVQGRIPEAVPRSIEAWVGCLAGALHEEEYGRKLRAVGFTDIEVDIARVYGAQDLQELDRAFGVEVVESWLAEGRFCSAFIRARRPI